MTKHGEPLTFFEAHVMDPSDGCRIWPYGKGKRYGALYINGKTLQVHRLTCERWYGPPADPRLEAAHTCGVMACWAGEHLRWKTHAENLADRLIHGTHDRGTNNSRSKFTQAQVDEIRERYATGESQYVLARAFNTTQQQISRVVRNERYP